MTSMRLIVPCLALAMMAGTAQAGFGKLDLGSIDQRPLVRVATEIDEMTPQMGAAYVEKIQVELAARGYSPGPIDGLMGQRTRGAIRAYQRDVGLPVDGLASKELLEYILFATGGATSGPEPVASLDPTFVRSVQIELVERGYYHGGIDGLAGPRTRAAVDAFQRDAGLVVNGAMDQQLLQELRSQPYNVRAYGN